MAERRAAPDHPTRSAAETARTAEREMLLGRVPQTPDKRDHRMIDRLKTEVGDAQLDMTLRDLLAGGFLSNWKDILAFWRWIKKRPSPKARRSKLWPDALQLDQGQTPHCVGFAWAQWGNSEPVVDEFQNGDGHALYYECKIIDGEPQAENGSQTRSGAKAMQQRGKLGEYVFAKTTAEITAWILKMGPVVVGTDWDGQMFHPDANGYLHPNGQVEGGHEWLLLGYDDGDPNSYRDKEPFYTMQNSWGLGWGERGRARITVREFQQLLDRDGDAAAGLELA